MTSHHQLKSQKRVIVGNKVKTLSREGLTPAVIYSKDFPSTPLQINTREFLKVYKESHRSGVIDLDIDGKMTPCIVQDIDVHPSKKTLRHVDFYVVNLKVKITTEVPISIINEAPGVKNLGGVLNIAMETLSVQALPDQMPDVIKIDVSKLVDFDTNIRVSDLPTSKTYQIMDEADSLVINLVEQSQEEEAPTPITEVPTPVAVAAK